MGRRFFNTAAVLSFVLCILVAVLWPISFWHAYQIGIGRETWLRPELWRSRGISVRIVQGYLMFSWTGNDFKLDHPAGIVQGWGLADAEKHKREHPGGFKWENTSFSLTWTPPPALLADGGSFGPADYLLGIPHEHGFGTRSEFHDTPSRTDLSTQSLAPVWTAILMLMLLPTAWVILWLRRHRRMAAGCCTVCGYDLRASPVRCPECGTEASL